MDQLLEVLCVEYFFSYERVELICARNEILILSPEPENKKQRKLFMCRTGQMFMSFSKNHQDSSLQRYWKVFIIYTLEGGIRESQIFI